MIGIIARLPQAFIQEVTSRFTAITGATVSTRGITAGANAALAAVATLG